MPQCTVAPTFHPGGLHVGPSIPWALQAHPEEKDTKDKDKEKEKVKAKPKRRPSWKERHQIVWSNDTQAPNTRSYFGRPVEKEDNPAIPRRRLRPTWRLEIAEEEHPVQAYQIFHAPSASWKEQGQWVMPDVSKLLEAMGSMSPTSPTEDGTASGFGPRDVPAAEVKEPERGNPLLKAVQEAQKRASEQRKKVNTPSLPCDLPHQRRREGRWNRKHAILFSRDNDRLQVNMRSYFDRWKDVEGGDHEREPTWRLRVERKPLIVKSKSESFMPRFQPQGGKYGVWHPIF